MKIVRNATITEWNEEEIIEPISMVETPREICELMVSLISKGSDARILDAGCGKGAFLRVLKEKGFKNIFGIEISKNLAEYCKRITENIVCGDFLRYNFAYKYDVIIGNPPYAHFNDLPSGIREEVSHIAGTKESDIYYAFIIKAVELLEEGGELIFIVPYGFTYNTFAKKVRKYLDGGVEIFIDLDEAHIFEGENPETVIFKYVKRPFTEKRGDKLMKVLRLKDKNASPRRIKMLALKALKERKANELFHYFERKPFSFTEKVWSSFPEFSFTVGKGGEWKKVKEVAKVCVGFVTGFDKAFIIDKNEEESLTESERKLIKRFIKAKNCKGFWTEGEVRYIFTNDIANEEDLRRFPNIFKRISRYKSEMQARYLPKGKKWFHWQAVRNREIVEKHLNAAKIFVPTLDRSEKNRFSLTYDEVYPSGDVLMIVPYQIDEFFLLGFLNSEFFRKYYLSNGGRRGGRIAFTQKLISEAEIPPFSEEAAQKISKFAKLIYERRDLRYRNEIERVIDAEKSRFA